MNKGQGTGFGIGILVSGANNRIEANHCQGNAATGLSWGIRIEGASNYIADNSADNNGTAGMIFLTATNNRTERNRLRETLGIDNANGGVSPASSGSGDLADVSY